MLILQHIEGAQSSQATTLFKQSQLYAVSRKCLPREHLSFWPVSRLTEQLTAQKLEPGHRESVLPGYLPAPGEKGSACAKRSPACFGPFYHKRTTGTYPGTQRLESRKFACPRTGEDSLPLPKTQQLLCCVQVPTDWQVPMLLWAVS